MNMEDNAGRVLVATDINHIPWTPYCSSIFLPPDTAYCYTCSLWLNALDLAGSFEDSRATDARTEPPLPPTQTYDWGRPGFLACSQDTPQHIVGDCNKTICQRASEPAQEIVHDRKQFYQSHPINIGVHGATLDNPVLPQDMDHYSEYAGLPLLRTPLASYDYILPLGAFSESSDTPINDTRQYRGPRLASTHPTDPICYEHGCNGQVFSSISNLRRHQREREGRSSISYCNLCGAALYRRWTRDQHMTRKSCKRAC